MQGPTRVSNSPKRKILFHTHHSSDRIKQLSRQEECFQIGCNDYLSKPFMFEQLGFRIKNLLKQCST